MESVSCSLEARGASQHVLGMQPLGTRETQREAPRTTAAFLFWHNLTALWSRPGRHHVFSASTVPTTTWQFGMAALWAPLQREELCVTMDNINYKCFLEQEPEAGLVAALCLPWCGLCWTVEPFWSVLASALSLALAEAQVKYQKYGYTEELLGI